MSFMDISFSRLISATYTSVSGRRGLEFQISHTSFCEKISNGKGRRVWNQELLLACSLLAWVTLGRYLDPKNLGFPFCKLDSLGPLDWVVMRFRDNETPGRVPGKSGCSINTSDFCFAVMALLAGHQETYSGIIECPRFLRSLAFLYREGN